MPRVLFVSHNHPDLMVGGTEVFSYELFRAVREHGEFEPIYLARTSSPGHRPGGPFHALGSRPDEILWFPSPHDHFYLTSSDKRQYTLHFRDLLSACRPDVVHFHHAMGLGLDMVRVARAVVPHAAIVYTLHEFVPICPAKGLMVRPDGELCREALPARCHECLPERSPLEHLRRERLIKAHFRHVDRFLAPSRFLRRMYVDWGIAEERIQYQPQGRIETSAAGPDTPSVSRIGFFGQMRLHKGVELLLRAVGRLRSEGIEVHLSLYGAHLHAEDTSFQERFRRLLRRAGSAATYHGPYPPHRVGDLMADVAWVVVPSLWWENSPLVIDEAFLAGRPVLCSDVGGMAEKVRDGVDGLHFRLGDESSLAAVLRRAVASSDSQELWRALRRRVPEVPSIGSTVDDHLRLYRSLLESRRAFAGRESPA